MAIPTGLLLAPADSARAVGEMYGVSLLATLPIVAAALAMVALRRSGAGARAMACRATVVALLAMYAGRFLPFHWMVWIVPEGLAAPLVALGRAQLSIAGALPGGALTAEWVAGRGLWDGTVVQVLFALYWTGVVVVLLRLARARWRLHRLVASASVLDSTRWRARIGEAARAAGLDARTAARVRLHASAAVRVPITWGGAARHVIVLPPAARGWSPAQLHAALVHELSHVRHRDAHGAVAGRLMCALYWFHPGAWWLSARLQRESELACDDRVLLSGVRRSDYAELLIRALAAPARVTPAFDGATALVHPSGVRARLAAIVDTSRVVRAPSHFALTTASLVSVLLAIPLGTVRVSPTRDVLTTLMLDGRWESRAYAVVRLAQRADSVEVARNAADHDPSPEVRAWAHFALAQGAGAAPERRGASSGAGADARALAPLVAPQVAPLVVPPAFLH